MEICVQTTQLWPYAPAEDNKNILIELIELFFDFQLTEKLSGVN